MTKLTIEDIDTILESIDLWVHEGQAACLMGDLLVEAFSATTSSDHGKQKLKQTQENFHAERELKTKERYNKSIELKYKVSQLKQLINNTIQ